MSKCRVSVIVPVYNVEEYIDDCIESIMNQTFQDIEILLIVGCSTDKSTEKSVNWTKRDNRIRMIKEEQRGLGPARNQGIREAKGEYIVFVDSDDIIKPTYIEKMYNAIVKEQADLVECDFSKIRQYAKNKEYVSCTKMLNRQFDICDKFLLGNSTMWKIMTKKELWRKYSIVQPYGAAEDFFTYPLLLFSAEKIVNVCDDLYCYRKDRPGNMANDIENHSISIANTMRKLLDECIRRGYFFKYKNILNAYIRRWISRYSSPCLGKINDEQYAKAKQAYVDAYITYFQDNGCDNEIILGGFNLSRIVNKLPIIEDPYCRINFMSLISIMSKKHSTYKITHKNRYREFMLKREYKENFFELVRKLKPKYFFFDLLEERHDILVNNNEFFTKSDAFDGADNDFNDSIRIINRDSLECRKMWEESCISFFKQMYLYVEPKNIIMIKNFLMEQYGDGDNLSYFENLNLIRKINVILSDYYQFIEKNFPDIQIVEIDKEDEYYYTDLHYEFGCYPWHLNEWENIKIAEKIRL